MSLGVQLHHAWLMHSRGPLLAFCLFVVVVVCEVLSILMKIVFALTFRAKCDCSLTLCIMENVYMNANVDAKPNCLGQSIIVDYLKLKLQSFFIGMKHQIHCLRPKQATLLLQRANPFTL